MIWEWLSMTRVILNSRLKKHHSCEDQKCKLDRFLQSLFTSVSTTAPNLPEYHEVSALAAVGFGFILAKNRRQPKTIEKYQVNVLDRLFTCFMLSWSLERRPKICESFAPNQGVDLGHFGPRIGHPIRWAMGLAAQASSYGILWDPEKWNTVFSANRMVRPGVTMNTMQICEDLWTSMNIYEQLWTMNLQPNINTSYLNQWFVYMCVDDCRCTFWPGCIQSRSICKTTNVTIQRKYHPRSCRQCLDKVHEHHVGIAMP